jgi:hypothetical protein
MNGVRPGGAEGWLGLVIGLTIVFVINRVCRLMVKRKGM